MVSSIVYLDSKVNFSKKNELRNNTLGGTYSPTNSYSGGPIGDIVCKSTNSPAIVSNNLIINNFFEGSGVYEPTNTSCTLYFQLILTVELLLKVIFFVVTIILL